MSLPEAMLNQIIHDYWDKRVFLSDSARIEVSKIVNAALTKERENAIRWIKASDTTPTVEGDYYVKYKTGEKAVLYASGTGHHKRWAALVDEWLYDPPTQ